MIELRNYQSWFRHHILEALKTCQSVLAVSPTGSGKRYSMVDLCLLAMEHSRQVLVVTNRRLLVTQMADECREHGVHYGVIMADHFEGDAGGPIQIASVQTLESWYLRPGLGALHGVGLPDWKLLLIDEGHSGVAAYRRLMAQRPDTKTISFTATPVGAEGKSLVPSIYEVMVEGPKNSELIAQGHLLPTTVYAPSEPNIEGVKIVNRQEYNQNQLGKAVHECTVFADVFEHWTRLAGDRATVCFVPGIPFGRDLVRQFNFLLGAGSAYLIEAKTKPYERERIFDLLRERQSRILVSCDVLREGFDMPVLSCAIDLQPNSQLRSYWQKVGRIKRPFGDQSHAIYLDFAGNYWRFPHPDEDPLWPQGEETTQEAIERSRKAGATSQPIMCPRCSMIRERGPTCPGCGYTAGELIRRIRMGNGNLKEIPAIAKEKRAISDAERLFTKWQGKLFGALAKGWTYGQCARLFHTDTGEHPKREWPGVFENGSLAWKQRVSDEFDKRKLAITCHTAKKRLR